MDKPQLPIIKHILFPDLLLILLVATRLPHAVRFCGFVTLTYLSLRALWFTTGNPTQDYFVGFFICAQTLLAIQLLLLRTPLDELRHERDAGPPSDLSFWRRLYWAFCLDHNARGVGWTHQVRNLAPRPTQARWEFLRLTFLRIVYNLFFADLFNTYIIVTAKIPFHGYLMHSSVITAWVAMTCCIVNAQYFSLATISIVLGISPPKDWPDVFGEWINAYTLRNFWGKVWHQNLRRLFTPISSFIICQLGVQRGTNASSYIQLYSAFFLSWIIHAAGDGMVHWRYALASAPFFAMQPIATTAEDIIIAHADKIGVKPSGLTRLIGYLWVFGWGSYTFAFIRDLGLGWDGLGLESGPFHPQ